MRASSRTARPVLVPLSAAVVLLACGSGAGSDSGDAIVGQVAFEATPAIVFEPVACGTEPASPAMLTITNIGGVEAAYDVKLSDGGVFFVKGDPHGIIPPGGSAQVPISVKPTIADVAEAMAFVTVAGIVQQVSLKGRGQGATLAIVTPLVDFGEVRFDRVFDKPFELKNTGDLPVALTGFTGAADGIDVTWEGKPAKATLAPGATLALTAAVDKGNVTGAPAEAKLTAVVEGPMCGPPPALVARALRVNTDVTLAPADFGQQPCLSNAALTRDVMVTNYALQPLTYAATLPETSAFTLVEAKGTVPAATVADPATAKVSVSAKLPVVGTPGIVTEVLGITIAPLPPPSGGARTTNVQMDVRGALVTVNPTSQKFKSNGRYWDSKSFDFTNGGNERIRIGYNVSGECFGAWSWDTPDDVDPGQTRSAVVSFLPGRWDDNCDATLNVSRLSGGVACVPLPNATLQGDRD